MGMKGRCRRLSAPATGHARVVMSWCLVGMLLGWSSVAWAQEAEEQAQSGEVEVPDEGVPDVGGGCRGDGTSITSGRHALAVRTNPVGLELAGRVGHCMPLLKDPSPLLKLSAVHMGAMYRLSPAYLEVGGFVEVAPVSVLVIGAEVAGLGYWPLGREGAAYYGFDQRRDDVDQKDLPADAGESALGFTGNLNGTLRFALPLGGVEVFALDRFAAEYYSLGTEPYYLNLRFDVHVPKNGIVYTNLALLGAKFELTEDKALRVAANSAWLTQAKDGAQQHEVGLLVSMPWRAPTSWLTELEILTRATYYTAHPRRQGEMNIVVAAIMTHDI